MIATLIAELENLLSVQDDVSLQLNQSEKPKLVSAQSTNIRQPLKHPKMRIKQPQNRYQPPPPIEVNKKQSNINIQRQQIEQVHKTPEVITQVRNENPAQVLVSEGQKKKALKFRENQLSQDVAVRREKMRENGEPIMDGFEDAESGGSYNDIMNKISMMDLPRQYKMNPEEIVSICSRFCCFLLQFYQTF